MPPIFKGHFQGSLGLSRRPSWWEYRNEDGTPDLKKTGTYQKSVRIGPWAETPLIRVVSALPAFLCNRRFNLILQRLELIGERRHLFDLRLVNEHA